jgi:hypothetical protein
MYSGNADARGGEGILLTTVAIFPFVVADVRKACVHVDSSAHNVILVNICTRFIMILPLLCAFDRFDVVVKMHDPDCFLRHFCSYNNIIMMYVVLQMLSY